MPLYAYVGRIGSGKTLSCVRHALNCREEGKEVWSNIKLNFPYNKITQEEFDTWSSSEMVFNNAFVLLDEFYLAADSRRSMSKMNLLNTSFLLQSRKKHCSVAMTAQVFTSLDTRIRQNCQLVIFCKFVKREKGDIIIQRRYGQSLTGQWKKAKSVRFIANPFYDLYNTDELILPNYGSYGQKKKEGNGET